MKKLFIGIIIFAAALAIAPAAHAEHRLTHGVGFAIGPTTGMGVSFAVDGPRIGLQLTGFPVWVEDGGMLNGGINIKFHGWGNDKIGFYGAVGVAGIVIGNSWENCRWNEETGEEYDCVEEFDGISALFIGGGPGFQLTPHSAFMLRFEIPVVYRFSGPDDMGVLAIPNLSVLYRW